MTSHGLFLLLLLRLLPLAASASFFPTVHTSYGAVRGYEYRAKNGFVGEIFKKIPFAAPPIGSRRWKKPAPPERWNYTLDATFYGPACAQHGPFWRGTAKSLSEDCLTLNIYTSRECRESNASCPVVVYIHGGSALFGGTSEFPDEALISNYAKQGVIMVTVAYRLGVFGVMALGDESALPANLAIYDVLESLRFISREIQRFGGDNNKISVMGNSIGATIVLALVFSPGIIKHGETPLFTRAIAMSTSAVFESEEKQVNRSMKVAAQLGCTGSAKEIVDCLRSLTADEVLAGAWEVGGADPFSLTHLSGIAVAGELMPIHNMKELRENHKHRKLTNSPPTQLMIGSTLHELDIQYGNGKWFEPPADPKQIMDVLGVNNEKECTKMYLRDTNSGTFDPEYSACSQALFMTTSLFAESHAQAGGEVYVYQLDYPVHSMHSDDLHYVMGNHEFEKDANEEWLSRVYPLYFTNFIKGFPLAPDWKQLDPQRMNYYSINKNFTASASPRMTKGYHNNLAQYYKGMMEFDEKQTKARKMNS